VADSQQLRERTLVVLKPDAVVRGLAGRIIQRFEDASLKIIGVKMREIDADFARRHYFDLEERLGARVYNATAEFMQRGPVIAFVLEGEDAVTTVRKIVGTTYPNEAQPGSIRGDFAHQSKAVATSTGKAVANLVHASGNREEAEYEIKLWFDESELYNYRNQAEAFGWLEFRGSGARTGLLVSDVRGALAQDVLLDLSGRGLGQLADKSNPARGLEMGQPLPGERDDVLLGRLAALA
jgi:nucleoside-diphosphate kinase